MKAAHAGLGGPARRPSLVITRGTPMRALACGTALSLSVLGLASGAGCSGTAIALKEKLGIPKRDQLVSKVEATRDSQEAAKEQFESALAEFIAVTGVEGGELEAKYKKLNSEYQRAEDRAQVVRSRITETDRVASALFSEWKAELAQYKDPALRRTSEDQLRETQSRYADLIGAMKSAAAKMAPVLARFHDQVLFLKHNLNARAVAGLRTNVAQMQGDVERLVRDMEASIAEANSFISQMK
jgi:hypothetical protein